MGERNKVQAESACRELGGRGRVERVLAGAWGRQQLIGKPIPSGRWCEEGQTGQWGVLPNPQGWQNARGSWIQAGIKITPFPLTSNEDVVLPSTINEGDKPQLWPQKLQLGHQEESHVSERVTAFEDTVRNRTCALFLWDYDSVRPAAGSRYSGRRRGSTRSISSHIYFDILITIFKCHRLPL